MFKKILLNLFAVPVIATTACSADINQKISKADNSLNSNINDIVFVRNDEIYGFGIDNELKRITNDEYPDDNPAVSLSGKKIFHLSTRRDTNNDGHLGLADKADVCETDLETGKTRSVFKPGKIQRIKGNIYPLGDERIIFYEDAETFDLMVLDTKTGEAKSFMDFYGFRLTGIRGFDIYTADGDTTVFFAARGTESRNRDTYEIFRVNKNDMRLDRLTDNNNYDCYPAVSPDGKRVAYFSQQDGSFDIYLLDLEKGTETRVTSMYGTHPNSLSFSPDGRNLVFGYASKAGNSIYTVDLNDKIPKRISDGHSPYWVK
jgi:tricorn protease-like protein